MIVDGKDLILGRVSSFVAKKALEGEKVDLVNSEKIVVSGAKKDVFAKYKNKAEKGNAYHGVFLPKMPDRFVKRVIRGMLPYKQERGITAYRRITCHIGIPPHFKDKESKTLDGAHMKKFKTMKFVNVKDLCAHLGGAIK